ncbi:hypothetical protein LCL95_10065 [Bacillus timonensis]|nr:hypothetical protein [Bacillus timonensis]
MNLVKSIGTLSLAMMTLFSTQTALAAPSENPIERFSGEKSVEEQHRAELREMWDKHVAVNQTNEEAGMYGEVPGYTGIGSRGDILIALDSITDHVAIVEDAYVVIESHPNNPGGNVAYRDNNWKERYNEIKGLRVSPASSSQKSSAVSYAANQIGEPYVFNTDRWSTNEWYCSKLVWRAYYQQGIELEGRKYETRGNYVTPGDILDSPNTYVFYSSY